MLSRMCVRKLLCCGRQFIGCAQNLSTPTFTSQNTHIPYRLRLCRRFKLSSFTTRTACAHANLLRERRMECSQVKHTHHTHKAHTHTHTHGFTSNPNHLSAQFSVRRSMRTLICSAFCTRHRRSECEHDDGDVVGPRPGDRRRGTSSSFLSVVVVVCIWWAENRKALAFELWPNMPNETVRQLDAFCARAEVDNYDDCDDNNDDCDACETSMPGGVAVGYVQINVNFQLVLPHRPNGDAQCDNDDDVAQNQHE